VHVIQRPLVDVASVMINLCSAPGLGQTLSLRTTILRCCLRCGYFLGGCRLAVVAFEVCHLSPFLNLIRTSAPCATRIAFALQNATRCAVHSPAPRTAVPDVFAQSEAHCAAASIAAALLMARRSGV
jgi:hypothetical protein